MIFAIHCNTSLTRRVEFYDQTTNSSFFVCDVILCLSSAMYCKQHNAEPRCLNSTICDRAICDRFVALRSLINNWRHLNCHVIERSLVCRWLKQCLLMLWVLVSVYFHLLGLVAEGGGAEISSREKLLCCVEQSATLILLTAVFFSFR